MKATGREREGREMAKGREDGEVTIPTSGLKSFGNSIQLELVREPLDGDDSGGDHEQSR